MFTALEKHILTFDEIKKNSYLAIAAINKNQKMAVLSNVVHVEIPLQSNSIHNPSPYTGKNQDVKKEKMSNDNGKKPDQILFYVLAGIISVVLICIGAVILILKKYQIRDENKRNNIEDPIEDFDIIDITDQDMMVNREMKSDVTLPTFYKVCVYIIFLL